MVYIANCYCDRCEAERAYRRGLRLRADQALATAIAGYKRTMEQTFADHLMAPEEIPALDSHDKGLTFQGDRK